MTDPEAEPGAAGRPPDPRRRDAVDWVTWHDAYDRADSSLSRRLGVVQHRLGDALDALDALDAPLGSGHRLLSLCAGSGRDVLPVLAARHAAQRPRCLLVELAEDLVEQARAEVRSGELEDAVQVTVGDAGAVATFADHLPVDVLLLCGIFGNVADADVRATVAAVPAMVRPGGSVIWTRGWFDDQPDLRPAIRRWCTDAGLIEVGFDGEPTGFGVGVARRPPDQSTAPQTPLPERLFTFVR